MVFIPKIYICVWDDRGQKIVSTAQVRESQSMMSMVRSVFRVNIPINVRIAIIVMTARIVTIVWIVNFLAFFPRAMLVSIV